MHKSMMNAFSYLGFGVPITGAFRQKRELSGVKHVLDIGCVNASTMLALKRVSHLHTTRADIHRPYLEHCQRSYSHDEIVLADAVNLPFMPKSLDHVICLEAHEHL